MTAGFVVLAILPMIVAVGIWAAPSRAPSASAAPVAGREPLTELTHIVFVRPLLGNKGVHIINGNVVNTKTDGLNGKGIRIASWNINHVSNKIHELKSVLQVAPRQIDVLGISEIFLTPKDHDARLAIDGFHQPERLDRKGKRGGGLLAYISTAFSHVRRRDLECDDIELLWVEVMPPRCVSFLVGFLYRPPGSTIQTDREIVSNIENVLCLITDVYVLGDINMDLMKGINYTLYNDLIMLGLDQLISEITRPESKSCIDHVYTNNLTNVLISSVMSIGLSDHCPVTVVRKHNGSFAKTKVHKTIQYRDFKHFNEHIFLEQLTNVPWSLIDMMNETMLTKSWTYLSKCIYLC